VITRSRPDFHIQAATNKSETFNRFVQGLFFGGEGLIAENDRDRQRNLIKYNFGEVQSPPVRREKGT
jgi:hypothetical protein